MDINYNLTRQQIELALARASTHPGARAAHQAMADRYGSEVATYRARRGVPISRAA